MPFNGTVQVCEGTPHSVNVIQSAYEYNIPVRCVELNGNLDDKNCLHHSIMSLQLLLGFHCLPQMYSAPRTLEAALRDLGVNEGEIDFDIKSCESYLQRAA